MAWFKVDDGFYDHPKVEELPNAAVGLWVKAGTWCAKHETDGVIPATRVKAFKGTASQIRALIECGLWSETTTNSGAKAYSFRDWFDYQPSREEREEERALWREKKKRERERRLNHARSGGNSGSVSGANRTQIEHGLGTNPNANATQNESDLNSNATQNEFKSRLQKDYDQRIVDNVPEGVPEMSPEGTNEGVPEMSGTIPDPSRPDPSLSVIGSQPTTGSRGQADWPAGDELDALGAATQRARDAGIPETAIKAGTAEYQRRPHPKGPGLLRTLINDAWDQERSRTANNNARAARRATIDACDRCDDNGWVIGTNPAVKCTHQPPLKAVGGPF